MKKLYVIVFLVLSCYPSEIFTASKTKKKTYKTTTESTAATTSQPAILAIEIVDPNENSTSAKQLKRTIETALGYGFNNFGISKPRYEVYKYSQHDIPPYKGDTNNKFQESTSNQVNIQKSVQYSLPIASQQVSSSSNLLQPGTTLYSSLSEEGHIGSLSTSLPTMSSFQHGNVPVPVVVLRLYPHQLKDSTIQAKLPKSHPYAKNINSLNIQSLLSQYTKTLKNPGTLSQYSATQESLEDNYGSKNQYSSNKESIGQGQGSGDQYSANQGSLGSNHGFGSEYSANDGSIGHYSTSNNKYSANQASFGTNQYLRNHGSLGRNTYTSNRGYSLPTSSSIQPTQASYQASNYNVDSYQSVPVYESHNGEAQNYRFYQQSVPQQSTQEYTKQSQYRQQQQQYPVYNTGVKVIEAPVKYEISPYQIGNQWRYQLTTAQNGQTSRTSSISLPQPEYYYVQPKTQNSYATDASQYYQPSQQLEYSKPSVATVAVPKQQYYSGNEEQQYSGYYQNDGQQYEANQKLLTYENYPTTQHTRVVFKTKSGDIRSPEPEQNQPTEIKTIKIHVPDDVAKVEVQETERPYNAHQATAYSDASQNPNEQTADTYQASAGYSDAAHNPNEQTADTYQASAGYSDAAHNPNEQTANTYQASAGYLDAAHNPNEQTANTYQASAGYLDAAHNPNEQTADTYQASAGLEQTISQNNYYSPGAESQGYYSNKDSTKSYYNQPTVNRDAMTTYFNKRGAMPKYFYQNPEETDDVEETSTEAANETKNLISIYEEAFPSTATSVVRKKVKSKKRI